MITEDNESDKILINKISARDEQAFEEFVGRHQREIINLIYRYTRSVPDAEELAQDVFVRVWQKAASFKGGSKVFTWLYRIAVNLAVSHLQKKKIPVKSLDTSVLLEDSQVRQQIPAAQDRQPDLILRQKAIKSLIENAIEKLPSSQKTAFMLSKYEDRSLIEAAEIMEVSIPTVKSLLFRAKQNLVRYLLPYKQTID